MDVPSTTFAVHSFAHSDCNPDPVAAAEIATEWWKAAVWESARFERVHSLFLGRASAVAAEEWYLPLTSEEKLHWQQYYADHFSAGRDAEKIPDEVTSLLEEAVERDCFQSFEILRCHQRFVLLGYLRGDWAETCVPIAAWYPEGDSFLDSDQLRVYYETVKAEEAERKIAADKKEREHAARVQHKLNRLRNIARIHWGVALAALGTILASFFLLIGWWALIPAVLILILAGYIRQESYTSSPLDLRQTLRRPLIILSIVALTGLAGTWLQFGTVTKSLTLCDSLTGFTYKTPEGEEYVLAHDAYEQLIDDASSSATKVVAEVKQHRLIGEPEVVSVRVVGDGYEACFAE